MRRVATAALLAIATACGVQTPALAQVALPAPTPVVPQTGHVINPLGIYAVGSFACAVLSPIIGTAILGREMTASEVGRSTLSCVLGPLGWVLGPVLFPAEVIVTT